MRLTILGCYTPYPPPGGACLGYLVEGCSTRVVLEFGSGVMAQLQKYLPFWKLDGILLSHLHGDHISDIFVYRYAIDQAVAEGKRQEPVTVWAPAEPAEEFARLGYKEVLSRQPLDPARELRIGEFKLNFLPTRHPLPTLACRLSDGRSTLVYTADTEIFPELASFAEGADLLLAEATFLTSDIEAGGTNHLSAAQAAELARSAGVKRLLLTHLRSWYNPDDILAEAVKFFPEVQVVRQDLRLEF
ncbi:MAG: hypothetical protein PWP65_1379 [Clostridia bacterium]|nr:hypothetical protein [Clostridia bacterium]